MFYPHHKDQERRHDYMRQYQRDWVKQQREIFFMHKKCSQCGGTKDLILAGINKRKNKITSFYSRSLEYQRKMVQKTGAQIICRKCRYHPTEKSKRDVQRRRIRRIHKKLNTKQKILDVAKKRGFTFIK